MDSLRDELKAEYSILQTQYEAFDARALQIKSWSAPLIGAVVGLGWTEKSYGLIVAAFIAASSLWLLEAIWKSFQYCYTDRIRLIEAYLEVSEKTTSLRSKSSPLGVKFGGDISSIQSLGRRFCVNLLSICHTFRLSCSVLLRSHTGSSGDRTACV